MTGKLEGLYKPSMALLTDLYQLTMAASYRRSGLADREATFNFFFRENPFGGGYALFCGLEDAVSYATRLSFDDADVAYLGSLSAADGSRLLDDGFLEYLSTLRVSCDIDAAREGSVVFPHEPLVRVTGPIVQCQLLETALLNLLNFPTLVATKASRVVSAASCRCDATPTARDSWRTWCTTSPHPRSRAASPSTPSTARRATCSGRSYRTKTCSSP